jgi:hypothetical protein|tara:strand:- start:353 stop:1006 length:654 start_codon:yes stop_codon:yes gene_type:complete
MVISMSRLLATVIAPMALLCPGALAHEEEPLFHTYESMECMRERECTEGVFGFNSEGYSEEIQKLHSLLNELEIEVYEAAPEYFVNQYRALYYSDDNRIFINIGYVESEEDLLEMIRHEGWHVAQDCMAGSLANSDLAGLLDHNMIPEFIMDETYARYGIDEPETIRIEREAVWAMTIPDMTIDALVACTSETPIWETYFPPKRTWQYLYHNGHINL